jgi:hypothetical protein
MMVLSLMNIAGTNVALAQEDLDHLMSLQHMYYVEMSNSLLLSKESDQEAQELVVSRKKANLMMTIFKP